MTAKNKKTLCALDIGTSKVTALIGEVQDGNLRIIGVGNAASRGLRNGMVNNIDITAQAIRQAVEEAELMADIKVENVIIGIAGNHIRSMNSQGMVKIATGEVTQADIDRALETARAVSIPTDHTVLHTVMQEFAIDNQSGVRHPIGMSGTRLHTLVHIITAEVNAVQNIEKCVRRVGLNPSEISLQPLASAQAVLTEDEKELGVCCIDIGGGTTDISVFTGGAVRHTAVLPVAGDLITVDLAHTLSTPQNSAEYIKIHHGAAVNTLEGMDEMIEVPSVGERRPRQIKRELLVSIIEPRISDIFEIVMNELERAGFPEETLSSGIVLTGGTSLLAGIVDLAEDMFNLPARIGVPREVGGVSERLRNPRFATAIGLLQQYSVGKHTGFGEEKEEKEEDFSFSEKIKQSWQWIKERI